MKEGGGITDVKHLIKHYENIDFISLAKDAYGTQLSKEEKQNIV